MDENEDYIRLGEQLLEEHMEGTLSSDIMGESNKTHSFPSETNSPNSNELPSYDKLYAKCILLNKLFKKNGITSFDQSISNSFRDTLKTEVQHLITILEIEGKKPDILETRNSSSTLEDALNLLSFSLLLLNNNNTEDSSDDSKYKTDPHNQIADNSSDIDKSQLYDQILETRSQEIIESEKLKAENQQLKKRISQCNYFFKSLAKQLNIPDDSSLSAIITKVSLLDFPNPSQPFQREIEPQNNYLRLSLIEQLHLNSDVTDDEILTQLKASQKQPEESDEPSLHQFCIEMFDLPTNSDENDIKIKLSTIIGTLADIENIDSNAKPVIENADDFLLSSEINSLKSQLKASKEQNQELASRNKLLKKLTKDSISESKDKTNTIEELNHQIDELSIQNDNLKQQLNKEKRLNAKFSSNSVKASQLDKNYSKAFNDLSIQLENQSSELSRISQNRNHLFEIIQLQKQLIEMLDKNQFYTKKKELVQEEFVVNRNLDILRNRLIQISIENKRNDLLEKLKENSSFYPQTEEMIINQIASLYSHIITTEPKPITPKKVTTKKENQISYESFKEICEYISSLLLFFDKLANSSATLNLLTDSDFDLNETDDKSNIREILSRYVQRITFFLQERQIDFVAPEFLSIPESIFTSLKKNPSKSNIQEFQMMQQHRVFVVLTVADILKNYSSKLEQRISQLEIDIRSLKNELKITEFTNSDKFESNNRKYVELTDQTTQKSFDEDSLVKNDEETFTDYNNSERFCCCNRNNQNEALKKVIKSMKRKYDNMIQEQEKTVDDITNQFVETEKLIQKEKERNVALENENKELTETLAIMTKRLSQFEIEKDNAIIAKASEVTKDYEAKLDAQMKINAKLNETIEEIKETAEKEQESHNIENEELEAENRELLTKIDKIRSNYDGLIKTYKEKYEESTANEGKLAEQVSTLKDNNKKISQELNETRIELKMQTLKNKSLADKVEREIALYQTKMNAMSSNYEISLNEKVQFNQIEYESRRRKFLVRLFETFRDFVDFSQKMTEENCIRIISKLVAKVKLTQEREKEFQQITRLVNEMKDVLKVETDNDLLTQVMLFSTKSGSDLHEAEQISSENLELAAKVTAMELKLTKWQQWANCMNSMLSDKFSANSPAEIASESMTVDTELRSKIEEKLLYSIGNRRIFRQIEILRNEKLLLLKQLNEYQTQNLPKNHTVAEFRHLIGIVIAIHRIQLLSGRLPSTTLGLSQISIHENSTSTLNSGTSSSQNSQQQENQTRRPIIFYS